jgi:hypothetical protein
MRIPIAAAVLLAATVLLAWDVEPAPTWFYVCAWYPILVILDAVAARLEERAPLLSSPRQVASIFGWSAIIWLAYEAANLRLENWYYVFLPRVRLERWTGILVSFATVVPALVFAERLLRGLGVGQRWRTRPAAVGPNDLRGPVALGIGMLVLPMIWPRQFSPLIWGAGLLLAEPFLYRKMNDSSLFADVYRGDWGRIGRLLLSGFAIGGLWEGLNYWARGKWIYTVPFLEEMKLFEMPPFGFIGFPVFALSAWSLYHTLCALGVAHPTTRVHELRRGRTAFAVIAGAVFAFVILVGMEARTISSTTPTLSELPAVNADRIVQLEEAGIRSPFDLARREPSGLSHQLGLQVEAASELVGIARLVTLRGIGTTHAYELQHVGIKSVCDLAEAQPEDVWSDIHALFRGLGSRPTAAEARVWKRASLRACPN